MQVPKFFRRNLCSELVSIDRLADGGAPQALVGNLEEIGQRTALILANEAVCPGTRVLVKGKGNELKGSVRSCHFDQVLGFFIDIGLDAETRWSEKWFVPEHLLRLCPALGCFTDLPHKVPEKFLQANPAPNELSAAMMQDLKITNGLSRTISTAKDRRCSSAPRRRRSDASRAARQRHFPEWLW